jgi:hypothetical protein
MHCKAFFMQTRTARDTQAIDTEGILRLRDRRFASGIFAQHDTAVFGWYTKT